MAAHDDNKIEVIRTCNFNQHIVELEMHSYSSLGLYICIVTLKLSGSCTFHVTAQVDASSSVIKIEPAHKPKLLPSLFAKNLKNYETFFKMPILCTRDKK